MKIAQIIRHENATCFAARHRQENIVRERLGHTANLQSFLAGHRRKEITGSVPRAGRRRNRPIRACEDTEDVFFEGPPILRALDTGPQLLSNDHAEVFERRKRAMKILQRRIGAVIAKRLDKELSVEDVLPGQAFTAPRQAT